MSIEMAAIKKQLKKSRPVMVGAHLALTESARRDDFEYIYDKLISIVIPLF